MTDMKIALVTGGSKGIGLQTVRRLHNAGCKVITCSRSEATWLAVLEQLPELSTVDYHSVDVSVDAELEKFFENLYQ